MLINRENTIKRALQKTAFIRQISSSLLAHPLGKVEGRLEPNRDTPPLVDDAAISCAHVDLRLGAA